MSSTTSKRYLNQLEQHLEKLLFSLTASIGHQYLNQVITPDLEQSERIEALSKARYLPKSLEKAVPELAEELAILLVARFQKKEREDSKQKTIKSDIWRYLASLNLEVKHPSVLSDERPKVDVDFTLSEELTERGSCKDQLRRGDMQAYVSLVANSVDGKGIKGWKWALCDSTVVYWDEYEEPDDSDSV